MSENVKRYLISSLITFATTFAIYFVSVIDDVTMASIADGALVSFIFTGVRAGIKSVLEMFILAQAGKAQK